MFSNLLVLIKAFIEFPKAIMAFVNLLKKTPQEKHEELLRNIQAEAQKFEDTGRPTW